MTGGVASRRHLAVASQPRDVGDLAARTRDVDDLASRPRAVGDLASRPRRARARLGAVVWALLLATVASLAWAQAEALDPEVFAIGNELRCPTCVSESVSESSSAIAREMRVIIQDQLNEGRTRAEILAFFQERYGDWILLNPPARGVLLIVWVLPALGALAGVVLLVRLVRRWRRAADEVPEIDPADRERVRAALAASAPPASPRADAATEPAPPSRA
jgi:cytochrome c-type biogenesis protein CcmH